MARGGKREGAGAPKGNTNGSRSNRLWRDTINRAIAQGKADRLRKIAEKLLEKAEEGDISALKELGDRLDGKPAQQVVLSGDEEGGPVRIEAIKMVIVDPAADDGTTG